VNQSLAPARQSNQLLLFLIEAPPEPFDLSAGIDQTLLACEERVAIRAQIDSQVCFGRSSLPSISAGAVHGRFDVTWMNIGLHAVASALVGATMLTRFRSLLARSNRTVPSTSAKSV
jgi:hypothetical protein